MGKSTANESSTSSTAELEELTVEVSGPPVKRFKVDGAGITATGLAVKRELGDHGVTFKVSGPDDDVMIVDTTTDQVQVGGGSLSVPGIGFIGDTGTGVYSSSAGLMDVVSGGSKIAAFGNGSMTMGASVPIVFGTSGSASAPAIQFDGDTGIFSDADNSLSLSAAGSTGLVVSSGECAISQRARVQPTSDSVIAVRFKSSSGADLLTIDSTNKKLIVGSDTKLAFEDDTKTTGIQYITASNSNTDLTVTSKNTNGKIYYTTGSGSNNGQIWRPDTGTTTVTNYTFQRGSGTAAAYTDIFKLTASAATLSVPLTLNSTSSVNSLSVTWSGGDSLTVAVMKIGTYVFAMWRDKTFANSFASTSVTGVLASGWRPAYAASASVFWLDGSTSGYQPRLIVFGTDGSILFLDINTESVNVTAGTIINGGSIMYNTV
jgi:hypothetical protein